MIDNTNVIYKCDEYTHGKRCSLCDSTDVSEETELVDDTFDGNRFVYVETYCQCNNPLCEWSFVTEEQSTLNLESRNAGRVLLK